MYFVLLTDDDEVDLCLRRPEPVRPLADVGAGVVLGHGADLEVLLVGAVPGKKKRKEIQIIAAGDGIQKDIRY